ncbi:hypothetical protein LHJ74_24790 [Streptomyces sp. N2-109]|uniref:Uncharacterized protein n=1 Tax=Streptomyces gossypii TaxID=2883101 RepID=A0ABT2JZK1_9ACTN|nr:gephyrin-like molybdotransferase receptor GlpR [Streptomyces gossypii]MCT2593088.1 hypothetical protein [Streptomyces gossypii]
MSSSGLIYAVIVGAWAAYLVPMWLRRQDELNEARPTERFSTAIRLLSGKAAMERRYARDAERRESQDPESGTFDGAAAAGGPAAHTGDDVASTRDPEGSAEEAVDVRAFAEPRTMIRRPVEAHTEPRGEAHAEPDAGPDAGRDAGDSHLDNRAGTDREDRANAQRASAERNKRARVLARRRRTTMLLFLAFTLGTIVAAVGGLAFLWAPGAPAALLSAYIVHLRAQERRRFTFTMDRRRAEEAARRLRERGPRGPAAVRERAPDPEPAARPAAAAPAFVPAPDPAPGPGPDHAPARATGPAAAPAPPPAPSPRPVAVPSADRRALVEQTDHAEWVDQERGRLREQPEAEGWDPVPVPLPTYVSAPVAPRTARGIDLDAPDTWSSARSSTAGAADGQTPEPTHRPHPPAGERGRTPLFDQYADEDRPRAANE